MDNKVVFLDIDGCLLCGNHTFCFISAGGNGTTLAIDNKGKAWSWGGNYDGALGINSYTYYSTPVAVVHTY